MLYYHNRIEILLHDEEIEKLHRSSVNKVTEPLIQQDFSPNDSRALLIRRDDVQPKIEDKFRMKDRERKAIWMLTKENERINKETHEDAVKETNVERTVKTTRVPDSLANRWPPSKR